jgi:ABC-2 type transport system permease protein
MYFVAPIEFGSVLLAKNITALFFVFFEITLIIAVCALLRMPITLARLAEAYSVTLVNTFFLMAVGNLTSTHNPRGVNPEKSMRSGATGQLQALLVLVYPLAGIPVLLAYGARYAFRSDAAFYVVLAIAGVIGLTVYWVAMESSVAAAAARREMIVDRLSQGEGLVAA